MSEGKKEILLGDCLELMKDIPNGSIDMILADLPYGTTQCKWDSIIDLPKLWEQYERIIKPNGAIVLTAAQPFTSILVMSNLKLFKYDWVWKKPKGTGHLNAKKQPMRDKEDVLVFYKNQCTYNPQWTWGKPYTNLKSGKTAKPSTAEVSGKYMNGAEYRNGSDGRRYPKQVQEFGVVERGTIHPTEKPVDLFRYFIRTYTNEGELVLDNTAGSGTTAIACLEENRQFIVMEQDPNYFEKIKKRVGDFNKNFERQTLFGNEM
jgi:site-specific DNA-methyltransferase (adenine-specific)